MPTRQIETNGLLGTGPGRVDGLAKVTGRARFGADQVMPGVPRGRVAHAWMETSPIARGRIVQIDDQGARAVTGVLAVLTYKNVGNAVRKNETLLDGGYMSQSVAPLHGDRIYFAGQIVAMVIAETAEAAQQGCDALEIEYEAEVPSATLGSRGTDDAEAKALGEVELKAGNAEAGLAAAAAVVDEWYSTPAQHHNPMELFQTTCAWDKNQGDKDQLTVWESTQNVRGFQQGVSKQLNVKPETVRILSPHIGGAFGSRGELGQQTSLVALAAQRLGRPVKLMATREQGFTLRTFRAETRHHLRLGADRQGHLTGLKHLSWELCSRKERFAVAGSDSTARLYACPNVETKVVNVEADRQAPGFMRAPPETPYLFALESAMDELAYKLGIDPLEMRRRNDTMVEPVNGRPYTSRSLVQCIDHGAEVFGWARRDPRPGSMTEGDDLIGYGFATAFYPTQAGPAECRVTLYPDLRAKVEVGTHEIGTGARTVVAMTVADQLGLRLENIETCIGDSELPAVPMSAGSNSTASVCSVVALACQALRRKIARRAVHAKASPLCGLEMDSVRLVDGQAVSGDKAEPLLVAVGRAARGKAMVEHHAHTPHGGMPWFLGTRLVRKGKPILLGGSNLKDRMQFAHGAQFVEVRIDRTTGEIRVPRMVGVYAAGRILNERTARAQLQGGQVWGISSALHEATEIDHGSARYVNQNLAEYHIPVCADVMDIQTIMIPEVDTLVNPLGLKGVGELGVTGVNAAIANAVFHATGVRVRTLPIRVGDILPRC